MSLLDRLSALASHHRAHRELALANNIAALVGSAGMDVDEARDFAGRFPCPAVKAHDDALETVQLAVAAIEPKSNTHPKTIKKARLR